MTPEANIPNTIYLQRPDPDDPGSWTWADERIDEGDVEYRRVAPWPGHYRTCPICEAGPGEPCTGDNNRCLLVCSCPTCYPTAKDEGQKYTEAHAAAPLRLGKRNRCPGCGCNLGQYCYENAIGPGTCLLCPECDSMVDFTHEVYDGFEAFPVFELVYAGALL